MATYNYPTNFELSQIEPNFVARGREGRLGLDILPARSVTASEVRWNQGDNFGGLQHLRGLDGRPTRVMRRGTKTYAYEPGIYGEYVDITETELTRRSGYAPAGTPIDVSDLVVEAQNDLINREMDRMESIIWALLVAGTFTIKLDGPTGTQVGFTDTFPIQTFTAGIAWSTSATAVPIVNFQAVQQLGQASGISVDFGAGATAYMNSVTSNRMLNNANTADLGGRRLSIGSTVNSMNDINSYWAAQNLAKIQVYDNGYYPTQTGATAGTGYTKFIPDGKVVVIGKRPGNAKIGEYALTRNANNPGLAPGSYSYVIDRANGTNAEKRTPANIEIHRGHNGGPMLYYPSAVLVMNV